MANILVIDDDRAVLSTIRILLARDGHDVETVDDSRAGLRLLETRGFDLLIVDIFMPGMDGFEAIRTVRQSRPEMPIIVISGHQFGSPDGRVPDFLHMATKLGAASSLQKPFKPHELAAAIASSLPDSAVSSRPVNATQGYTPSD
jgi:DNA-binding response OmpR family regulator